MEAPTRQLSRHRLEHAKVCLAEANCCENDALAPEELAQGFHTVGALLSHGCNDLTTAMIGVALIARLEVVAAVVARRSRWSPDVRAVPAQVSTGWCRRVQERLSNCVTEWTYSCMA